MVSKGYREALKGLRCLHMRSPGLVTQPAKVRFLVGCISRSVCIFLDDFPSPPYSLSLHKMNNEGICEFSEVMVKNKNCQMLLFCDQFSGPKSLSSHITLCLCSNKCPLLFIIFGDELYSSPAFYFPTQNIEIEPFKKFSRNGFVGC